MKNVALILSSGLALAAVCVWGAWTYEGEWSQYIYEPLGFVVAPSGDVYVGRGYEGVILRYTATGSFLGSWETWYASVSVRGVAANGNVYARTAGPQDIVAYYTPTGSEIGSWDTAVGHDVAVAPNGNVYVNNQTLQESSISYYTATGSFLGSWRDPRLAPRYVDVAPNGNVYVGVRDGVLYCTAAGSFLGSWGSTGSGPGQFRWLTGLAVAPDGTVFTCERGNNDRVQYFTPTGSYLGQWGSYGQGPGQFDYANDVDVSPTGARVYVLDIDAARVQYFNRNVSNVVPASLGRVKALFR